MENPWFQYADNELALLEQFQKEISNREYDFVLRADRDTHGFKDIYERPLCLQTYLPPLPYVGNPEKAEVILLCKNGGFIGGGNDPEYANDQEFVKQCLKSLKFESRYPIHYLDPRFKTYGGAAWWENALKYVVKYALSGREDNAKREQIHNKIAGIQWIPYHSNSFSINKEIRKYPLYSLAYTCQLLENALHDPKQPELVLIYGNGNKNLWADLLREDDKAKFLKKAICKKPDYRGDIKVKMLEPSFFQQEDLNRIIDKLNT